MDNQGFSQEAELDVTELLNSISHYIDTNHAQFNIGYSQDGVYRMMSGIIQNLPNKTEWGIDLTFAANLLLEAFAHVESHFAAKIHTSLVQLIAEAILLNIPNVGEGLGELLAERYRMSKSEFDRIILLTEHARLNLSKLKGKGRRKGQDAKKFDKEKQEFLKKLPGLLRTANANSSNSEAAQKKIERGRKKFGLIRND